ncbi:MAG: ABC transporter permease subunit [Alphaproteobacteria bacterium]|jgi:oligopeptide transport system permease protein|nr:MAG: ABC transporter permease subunit [Alphaproteobacteria bacterium]
MSRIPWAYTGRRILAAIPTMLAIITVAFFMMRAAPGSPYSTERKLTPAVEANLKAQMGLDKPLHEQYFEYVGKVVQGDLGPSMQIYDKSVSQLLGEGLPVSLTIGGLAITLGLFFGIMLGIIAAMRQNSLADYSAMSIAMIGISIPTFVTGPLLSLVFGVWLHWFAAGGLDLGRMNFNNIFLPVVTLALPQIAIISRLMRASMIEVLRSNSIRTARAKGLSEFRIMMRHALPAAILPVVSYLGPAIVGVITGSVVIESVFGLPGVGSSFIEGAVTRDYTRVMGAVILYGGLIIVLNLIADILYALLDPKVRFE